MAVIDAWKEHVEAMRRGLRVDGVRGEFSLEIPAQLPSEFSEPIRTALLAVKSVNTEPVLDWLAPLLGPDSRVVSLQNGLNEDRIAARVGAERTIGCMIGWGATSVGPGHVTQTSKGDFFIGYLDRPADRRLEEIRELLAHVTRTHVTDNIRGHLWSKLLVNCVIALAALRGSTVGDTVASSVRNKRLFLRVIDEGIQVATALGVRLEKFENIVDPSALIPKRPEDEEISFMVIDMVGAKHGNIYPGPLQDLEKGRKTEVDYINGEVVAAGRRTGVPTPVNEAIVRMMHEIEDGRRRTGEANLDELAAMAGIPE